MVADLGVETFDEIELKLLAVGEAEGGKLIKSRPDRWYRTHLYRCTKDHVKPKIRIIDGREVCIVAGCGALACLTFPEDRYGPLNLRIIAGKFQGNPPGCSCEHIHRSSSTCPCRAPSKGALKD